MLFHIWFFILTPVICHEYIDYQNTLRKPSIYCSQESILNAGTPNTRHFDVLVRDGHSTKILSQFWKSTGLCPPDPHQQAFKFFLANDMNQNFFHIGSLPFKGINLVRIHWLLDLVQMRINSDFSVTYNFTYLDQLIHELWKNDLHIGFELMGNPSNYYTDFENFTQVYMWRDLVKETASHYITLYGIDYVKEWNFETWNEPDHHDFDKLNFTIQGFLNYYDACSEGLIYAEKSLKFGGPGGSCRIPGKGHSPFCWSLLKHCIKGRNYFTGKIGSRLDFISFHKKGNSTTFDILKEEWETIEYMRSMEIPNNIPFYNDEADPMKNWASPEQWRADVTYASMVVKIISSHIELYFLKNGTNYVHFGLLSNDNAFLSYFPNQFTQRTLLARFQVNNTSPQYVEFIKKPVYTIFGLLSQLCPNILLSEVYYKGKQVRIMNDYGIIATHCMPERNQIVLIMFNSADAVLSNVTFDIDLIIKLPSLNEKGTDIRWVALELNNYDSNPYSMWEIFGKPAYPTRDQFLLMKEKEEPLINGPWHVKASSPLKLHLQILNPGVTLVNICKGRALLKKVAKVRFFLSRNSSLHIAWTDKHNRCVLTYNLEYSVNSSGPYIQINNKRIVFPSYFYACNNNDSFCSVKGFYRIYAVDYWYARGPPSMPVKYNGY